MADLQDRLARIQAKITALKEKDPDLNLFGSESHTYKLNEPLSNQTLTTFENEHQITLPQDYRAFLEQIGNGGMGPYYGLETLTDGLCSSLDYKDEKYGVQTLSEPFPHTDDWNAPGYKEGMSDEDYDAWQELCFQDKEVFGLLRIANFGCGVSINLVVNGPSYGEIWVDDRNNDNGVYPDFYFGNEERLGFLEWYELWLDKSIEEFEKA
ncbi:SMI1/KNR4 family protein [Listeria innocua]|uniref:SMI1/KNR4 family protein n=1 Tax=Listeria innocua TaxID=1642 RepID=UPI00098E39C5|nr:SMI1/KNR4 family protein [Listeria innocua]MBC6116950.1 SMI1/KNR4 family protein [Listeria innocua]UVD67299.1 SMI1/KNR4 family protein [Listeria innocua]HAA0651238.1 SMI1/KNR4 family protein [Listeria innocua]